MEDVTGFGRCKVCGQPRITEEFHDCCDTENDMEFILFSKKERIVLYIICGTLIAAALAKGLELI